MSNPNQVFIDAMEARRKALQVEQTSNKLLKDKSPLEVLTEALAMAQDAPDLNMNNYDDVDAERLNDAMADIHCLLTSYLSEISEA